MMMIIVIQIENHADVIVLLWELKFKNYFEHIKSLCNQITALMTRLIDMITQVWMSTMGSLVYVIVLL